MRSSAAEISLAGNQSQMAHVRSSIEGTRTGWEVGDGLLPNPATSQQAGMRQGEGPFQIGDNAYRAR